MHTDKPKNVPGAWLDSWISAYVCRSAHPPRLVSICKYPVHYTDSCWLAGPSFGNTQVHSTCMHNLDPVGPGTSCTCRPQLTQALRFIRVGGTSPSDWIWAPCVNINFLLHLWWVATYECSLTPSLAATHIHCMHVCMIII